MKVKKTSLTGKILIIAIAVLTVTIVLFAYISTLRSQESVKELMRNRMINITNSAAAMINGDDLMKIKGDISDAKTEEYKRINSVLEVFYHSIDLKYVYAVKKLEDGYGVVVDPDMQAEDEYGEIIESTDALEAAMGGVSSADDKSTQDRWGSFYSSYSPVYNSEKDIVGVVAVDFDADWFDTRKGTLDRFLFMLCIVIVIGSAIIVWIITKRARKELNERRHESERLKQTKRAIEQAEATKRDFLGHITQQVRTPVHTVLEKNEKILEETHVDRTRLCANNILTAGHSLLSMINDILDYSNLVDNKIKLEEKEYDIVELIDKLARTISPSARENNLQFELTVDEVLPRYLYGDAPKLSQVIMNLLSNAVKFTLEGSVKMSVFMVALEGKEVVIKISVEDTGVGIHPDDMNRLFNAFERFDREKNNTTGTGLGMAIVQKLLELMDTELTVESLYGEGSIFTFMIRQGVVKDTPIGDFEHAADQLKYSTGKVTAETENSL